MLWNKKLKLTKTNFLYGYLMFNESKNKILLSTFFYWFSRTFKSFKYCLINCYYYQRSQLSIITNYFLKSQKRLLTLWYLRRLSQSLSWRWWWRWCNSLQKENTTNCLIKSVLTIEGASSFLVTKNPTVSYYYYYKLDYVKSVQNFQKAN